MSTYGQQVRETFEAGQDLSSYQFHFVTLAADGQVDPTGDGLRATGVLYNDPDTAGQGATVVISGRVQVVVGSGGVTAAGAVASDASAEAVDAATGDIIMGYATEAGSAGEIITIDLIQGGNAA